MSLPHGSIGAWRPGLLARLLVVPVLTLPLASFGTTPGEPVVAREAPSVPDGELEARPLGDAPWSGIAIDTRVERWLEEFRTGHRNEFEDLLEGRESLAALILGELRERGMPRELLYIAMIESGLSPSAVSPVSAVGLWQFMSPTAMQYGLRIDRYVDERMDPIRATDAALDYLQWLHGRFGSWYLAAAAFNAGPGRLERILNRGVDRGGGGGDIASRVLPHLPRETRDYLAKLIAITVLANDTGALDVASSHAQPYRHDAVSVLGSTPLSVVADMLDSDASVLGDLNPHLIRGLTPPGEIYSLRVPPGEGGAVTASSMAAHSSDGEP